MKEADAATYTLALSGGGFRATFFHLGVLAYLHHSGKLREGEIKNIVGVSGGAIIAMHAVLNWDRYASGDDALFIEAAQELVAHSRQHPRRYCTTRWLWTHGFLFGFFLTRSFSLSNLHRHLLAGLFRKPEQQAEEAVLHDTKHHHRAPKLHVVAVDHAVGRLCSFSDDVFLRFSANREDIDLEVKHSGALPAAIAVAASACFPPYFSPIKLTNNDLVPVDGDTNRLNGTLWLADGGVLDNLGLNSACTAVPDNSILVSCDATPRFDSESTKSYRWFHKNAGRSTELMMDAGAEDARQRPGRDSRPNIPIKLRNPLCDGNLLLPVEAQQHVLSFRTDLDRMTDTELHCLICHGYQTACRAFGDELFINKSKELICKIVGAEPKPQRRATDKRNLWCEAVNIVGIVLFWAGLGFLPIYMAKRQATEAKQEAAIATSQSNAANRQVVQAEEEKAVSKSDAERLKSVLLGKSEFERGQERRDIEQREADELAKARSEPLPVNEQQRLAALMKRIAPQDAEKAADLTSYVRVNHEAEQAPGFKYKLAQPTGSSTFIRSATIRVWLSADELGTADRIEIRKINVRYKWTPKTEERTEEISKPAKGATRIHGFDLMFGAIIPEVAGYFTRDLKGEEISRNNKIPATCPPEGVPLIPRLWTITVKPGKPELVQFDVLLRAPGECTLECDFTIVVNDVAQTKTIGPYTLIH